MLINSRFISAIDTLLDRDNTLTKRLLSQKFNISQQKLTDILKGRMNVGADVLAALVTIYPDISADWLLTGEGSMLRTDTPPTPSQTSIETPSNDTITALQNIIKDQAKDIAHLEMELEALKATQK